MNQFVRNLAIPVLLVVSAPAGANSPTEAEAVFEISQMDQETCRGALFLNTVFYSATKNMSEEQRRSYFPKFAQAVEAMGIPAPRPPPHPDSAIAMALKSCAEGGKK